MPIALILSLLKTPAARYALAALACAAFIWMLYGITFHRGFESCKAEYVARENAAALIFQNKATDALSAEMLASAARQSSHALLTRTIGANHDTDADAPAPAIIRASIDGLYGTPLRPAKAP